MEHINNYKLVMLLASTLVSGANLVMTTNKITQQTGDLIYPRVNIAWNSLITQLFPMRGKFTVELNKVYIVWPSWHHYYICSRSFSLLKSSCINKKQAFLI